MKTRDEKKEAVKFGVILGIGAGLIAAWLQYKGSYTGRSIALGIAAPSLLLPFLARPLWLRFFRVWMKLAEMISWVMTRVILSVFFYLLLTPMAVVMRLFGRRPLDVAFKDGKETYWKEKPEGEYTLDRYQKLY
jgi:hypothetical protein